MSNSPRQVVSTGLAGLDRALGGGAVLVEKLAAVAPSTTILVRGGPGAGKSLFALSLANGLIGADQTKFALYVCLEQSMRALRAQALGLDPAIDVALIEDGAWGQGRLLSAALVVSPDHTLEKAIDTELPALLDQAAVERSRAPFVLVVDAVASGLGANANRATVDALSKLSAQRGLVLIVVEESSDLAASSPWPFAFDHVFELGMTDGQRTLTIAKARFGAAVRGPHFVRFERRLRVFPALETYTTDASLEEFATTGVALEREWSRSFPLTSKSGPQSKPWAARAYVVGANEAFVRDFAASLLFAPAVKTVDVAIELSASRADAPALRETFRNALVIAGRLPPEAIMEAFRRIVMDPSRDKLGRVFCGDLRELRARSAAEQWQPFLVALGDVCRALKVPLVLWDSSAARFDAPNFVNPVRELASSSSMADVVFEIVPTNALRAVVLARGRQSVLGSPEIAFDHLLASLPTNS
ncbi:MAG: hypothetical protein JNK05_15175 [Myxococcales bacterium]|nr:hypothetical protein [Myxococcales bacterium]